jgi:hypothetical protein
MFMRKARLPPHPLSKKPTAPASDTGAPERLMAYVEAKTPFIAEIETRALDPIERAGR